MQKIKLSKGYTRTQILSLSSGKGRYINKIIFYDKMGVVCELGGYIEGYIEFINKNGKPYTIERDIENLEIFEPIKKNKIDLSIKNNFYISSTHSTWGGVAYDLYIYCNDGESYPKVTQIEEKATYITNGESHIYKQYLFENIKGTATQMEQATAKEINSPDTIYSGGEYYKLSQKECTKFIVKKFDRIERTAKAEKIREIEHILAQKYKLYSISQAKEIAEIYTQFIKDVEKMGDN